MMHRRFALLWNHVVQIAALLVLIRVPLLMVLAGILLSMYVAQIRELFDISLEKPAWVAAAWVFCAGFSLLVWYSARTLYSFRWPQWRSSPGLQQWLGEHLPRLLATAAPLTLALAYAQADSPPGLHSRGYWSAAFLALALGLWLFTTCLRPAAQRVAPNHVQALGLEASPTIARLERWGDLPWLTRRVHAAGLIALPLSWVVGLYFPGAIDGFGPLALILGAASFSVWASTWPIYLAARLRFPLLSALLTWAVLMTAIGLNDNHAVRLSAGQQSYQAPPTGLGYGAEGRPSLGQFGEAWWQRRREACGDQIWLVSSEGGGIRAAMWTVLVLSELHRQTGGRLWACTFAASGVSGGSLGLAVFAGAYRDLHANLDDEALGRLQQLLQADFLAPVLGSMFGIDAVQRFLPLRLFSDRGEALENAWRAAYARQLRGLNESQDPDSLSGTLADTLYARDTQRTPLPALLLNATAVESGLRVVQHPFRSLSGGDLADTFPGAIDGAEWLPRELPTFSAVHNSARFTLVSPAGTVLRRRGEAADGAPQRLGQLVDGGYFENSATTTLQALIARLRGAAPGAPLSIERSRALAPGAQIRVIHISNDDAVPAFARNRLDRCTETPAAKDSTAHIETTRSAPLFGEARAPLIAILATRNARGEYARQALMDQIEALGGQLWHFRLCRSERVLPLGWTLSPESTQEMLRQLGGNPNLDPIRRALPAPTPPSG